MARMPHETIRFEDFELDPRSFELRRAGHLVKLERIPLQLLFLLAENRERLVTREEILLAIWGKDVFVDADNSINTAVRKARQALKEDPENPRFLRTIPGKGYRFTAVVSTQSEAATPIIDSSRPGAVSAVPKSSPISGILTPKVRWTVLVALVLIVLATTGLILRSRLTKPSKGLAKKEMLVVLPFVNLSADPHEDFFADGMTEEMITQLGTLDPQHLGVIARTSSMQYKDAKKGAGQIARELGVDYLLEGSVRRSGQRVRVTAQLIQASDQTHLWAADFDRDLSDVLKLQSALALAISTKIELTLSPSARARLADVPPLNGAAYEAYLHGLNDSELRTKPSFQRAISEFQQAITLDPNYAPAHAALARVYSLAPVVGAMTPMESMPMAREAALRAVTLDPSLAAGHSTLGFILAHFDFDWPAAEREYQRALDLNPNDAYAHLFYSNSYLSPLGRHAEAIAEMQKAIAADPFSAPMQSFLGRTYIWARQYDKALAEYRRSAEMFPGFAIDHERLAQLLAFLGKFEDAIDEDTKARLLVGEEEHSALQKEAALRHAFSTGGSQGYWKQLLDFTRLPFNPPEAYNSSFGTAILYAQLGEKSNALDSLEKAYEQRSLSMTELAIEPSFDPIRSDPRFQTLLRRVGLEKTIVMY
jgi:TolB-like protein/DNA-binding winged helix-turn-helix (wHTH) protein/Tfp pilus assembly protein PilF